MEKEMFHAHLDDLKAHFGDVSTINLEEAAAYIGVCRETLEREKTFPVRKLGRLRRVPLIGLARWLA